jgi:hypothetical protein
MDAPDVPTLAKLLSAEVGENVTVLRAAKPRP